MRIVCFVVSLVIVHWGLTEMRADAVASEANRPNIVLLMADDLGWGDAGFRGHKELKTPHLDAMAKEGLRFNRFYSAAPVCSPTRASAVTGRHPYRVGIRFANIGRMPKQELTLAEALKTIGYRTGHFGKWHMGTLTTKIKDANRGGPGSEKHYAPPWEHGFDVCFSTESKVPTWDPAIVPAAGLGHRSGVGKNKKAGDDYGTYFWTGPGERATGNLEGDASRVVMDRAIPFIETCVENQQPFFTIVWFHTPHLPTIAGGKYLEMYKHLPKDEQHYYGAVTAMDDQIGRIRQRLQELNVAENTMVWFCSDNGPENRTPGVTGGLRERKRSLYEGGIRVHGLLTWPARVKLPQVTDIPCVTSDYLPTILAAVDLDRNGPKPLDGINLLPLIDGKMSERPIPIGFQSSGQRVLVDNRYKIYAKGKSAYELYDLQKDRGEKKNIAKDHPEIVKSMSRILEEWQASCKRSAEGDDYK